MKRMKTVLSVLLVITLLFSVATSGVAAEGKQKAGSASGNKPQKTEVPPANYGNMRVASDSFTVAGEDLPLTAKAGETSKDAVDATTAVNMPASTEALDAKKEQVIIGFRGKPQEADLAEIRAAGGNIRYKYDIIPAVAAELPSAAVASLGKRANIAYVETDAVVYSMSQTIPWGIKRTGAPETWEQTTGMGVKVAVLDSGIDLEHSDLKVYGGINTITGGSYHDTAGHGTHVSGIIAALSNSFGTVGMAPQAELYAVKVISDGSGTISSVVAGIDWAIKNGMRVINMSFGTTTDSASLRTAVNNAYAAGILLVASAGNNGTADGSGDTVRYPARYDSVIAVAATDINNARAEFSATGPAVELSAPAVGIYSTVDGNSYGRLSGTSMASPHVAGAAAQIWAANSSLTNVQVRQILRDSATPLGAANHYGYGLVNVPAALKLTGGTTTTAPAPEPAPAPSPEPEPAPVASLSLAVSTNKAEYTRTEKVVISASGLRGETVAANEAVRITVNRPNGKAAARYDVILDQNGRAVVEFALKRNDPTGTYSVVVSGDNAEARTSFLVR